MSENKIGVWLQQKPEITSPCVLATATFYGKRVSLCWEYKIWQVAIISGFNEDGKDFTYLGVIDSDGDEWGYFSDLSATLYMILPDIPNDILDDIMV